MAAMLSDGQPFFTLRNSREVIMDFYAWAHSLQDNGANFAYRHCEFYDVLYPGGSPDYYLILHPLDDETQAMMRLRYSTQFIPDTKWYSSRNKFHKTQYLQSP